VHTEFHNMNWVMNMSDLDSTVLVEEFVMLSMALESVQLNQENILLNGDGQRWYFLYFLGIQLSIQGLNLSIPSNPSLEG
jgi:hypothetical protein